MVTALKDRTQQEAIERIPRSRSCGRCGGWLYVELRAGGIEAKCINCGHDAANNIIHPRPGKLAKLAFHKVR